MNRMLSSSPLAFAFAFAFALSLAPLACTDTRGTQTSPEPATSPDPGANVNAAREPAPTDAPASLAAAHDAYLRGDFIAMSDRIRDVLLDPSSGSLAKDNALELLEKGYQATHGNLPSRFVLPRGFKSMQLSFIRSRRPYGLDHTLYLYMRVEEGLGARISEMTLERLPSDVILDRASGKGRFRIKKDAPGYDDVVLESGVLPSLPAEGVFSIRVVMDGAPVVDTWVIASRIVSSAFPDVEAPAVSSAVSAGNPTVRWRPFRSPELTSFEWRTVSVYLEDEKTKSPVWDYWKYQPEDLSELHIGAEEGAPKTTLAPGPYYLTLTAGEERAFGPITFARQSQTQVPFDVVR